MSTGAGTGRADGVLFIDGRDGAEAGRGADDDADARRGAALGGSRILAGWFAGGRSARAERWDRKRLTRGNRTVGLERALNSLLNDGAYVDCPGCAARPDGAHVHRRITLGTWTVERLAQSKGATCYAAVRDGAERAEDSPRVLEISSDAHVCAPMSRMLPGYSTRAEAALEDLERQAAARISEDLAHSEALLGGLGAGGAGGAPPNAPVLDAIHDRLADGVTALWSDAFEAATEDEVLGQPRAMDKLSRNFRSPYPRHVLAYGPPGCGKSSGVRAAILGAVGSPTSRLRAGAPVVEVDGANAFLNRALAENTFTGGVVPWQYERNVGRRNHDRQIPMIVVGAMARAHGGAMIVSNFDRVPADLLPSLYDAMDARRIVSQVHDFDPANPHMTPAERAFLTAGIPADCLVAAIRDRRPGDGPDARAWDAAGERDVAASRFLVVEFEPLEPTAIAAILERGAGRLGIGVPRGVLDTLAAAAGGDARRACSMLLEVAGAAAIREGRVGADIELQDAFAVSTAFDGILPRA